MNKEFMELSIEGVAFDGLRADFDKIIKRTIANMQRRESSKADITVKLTINLEDVSVPDYEGPQGATRMAKTPKFDYKVSSAMQSKDEESGNLKGNYELRWNEDLQDYVMVRIDNGQMDMFRDMDVEQPTEYVQEELQETKQLEGKSPLMLEAPAEEEGEDEKPIGPEAFDEEDGGDFDFNDDEEEDDGYEDHTGGRY